MTVKIEDISAFYFHISAYEGLRRCHDTSTLIHDHTRAELMQLYNGHVDRWEF